MKYRDVLFDLDGTLVDPKEGITKSISYALAALGIEESDFGKLCSFIGPPLQDSFRDVYGMSEDEVSFAIEKYRERFSDKGIYENEVYPGILELLASLKSQDVRVALATSKPTVYAIRILEQFGLCEFFDYGLGSELDGTRRAKADVVKGVLAWLGDPELSECVMVGDRSHDIVGAQACGIDSIGVLYGYGSSSELAGSGATFLAATVNELKALLE